MFEPVMAKFGELLHEERPVLLLGEAESDCALENLFDGLTA